METAIYNQSGKKSGTIDLPKNIFGVPWNADLVHQVMVSMTSNARAGTANTKGRGEVRGGGKKPWEQKGTGRARHGSIRSPIWAGGGITHGPLAEKNYAKKINKKMRAKALFTVLSKKFADGEIMFINELAVKDSKTKAAHEVLKTISATEKSFDRLIRARKKVALIATPRESALPIIRAYKNLVAVSPISIEDLNVIDVLNHRFIIIGAPEASIALLAKKQVTK